MPLEDYTTYTEYNEVHDPLEVAANLITGTDLDKEHDHYVYRDLGVGGVAGDIEVLLTTTLTATTNYGFAGLWAISNNLDDRKGMDTGIGVHWRSVSSVNPPWRSIEIVAFDSGLSDYSITLELGTPYYLIISRAGGVATADIYSDAAHTVLVDSVSVVCTTDAMRYLYATYNWDANETARKISFVVGDLDLQAGGGEVVDLAVAEAAGAGYTVGTSAPPSTTMAVAGVGAQGLAPATIAPGAIVAAIAQVTSAAIVAGATAPDALTLALAEATAMGIPGIAALRTPLLLADLQRMGLHLDGTKRTEMRLAQMIRHQLRGDMR